MEFTAAGLSGSYTRFPFHPSPRREASRNKTLQRYEDVLDFQNTGRYYLFFWLIRGLDISAYPRLVPMLFSHYDGVADVSIPIYNKR